MKFREHKGTLAESLQTEIEIDSYDGLIEYIRKILEPWPTAPPVDRTTVSVNRYAFDIRLSKKVWIVVLKDYGVVGFTDEEPK